MRSRVNIAIEVWKPPTSSVTEEFSSERVWLQLTNETSKIAVCGLYCRTNKTIASDHYKKNEELFSLIQVEVELLAAEGYKAIMLGDFNGHVEKSQNFRFTHLPHAKNNNGNLLMNFATNLNLQCLNPLDWGRGTENKLTYQKRIGDRYVSSIIDYGLSTPEAGEYIADFKVDDSDDFAISSDHATLVLTLKMEMSKIQVEEKEYLHIRNLAHYKKTVKSKLANTVIDTKTMTVTELANKFSDILYKSATQCSTGKVARKSESKKLQRLRKKSLQLARKIKKEYRSGRMDRFTSAEREYEKVIEKQKKAEREIEKRKLLHLRAQMNQGGKKARKLFWRHINPKIKTRKTITLLEKAGRRFTDPDKKAEVIEAHFKSKFKTTDEKKRLEREEPSEELRRESSKMSSEDQRFLESPITMEELKCVIKVNAGFLCT